MEVNDFQTRFHFFICHILQILSRAQEPPNQSPSTKQNILFVSSNINCTLNLISTQPYIESIKLFLSLNKQIKGWFLSELTKGDAIAQAQKKLTFQGHWREWLEQGQLSELLEFHSPPSPTADWAVTGMSYDTKQKWTEYHGEQHGTLKREGTKEQTKIRCQATIYKISSPFTRYRTL